MEIDGSTSRRWTVWTHALLIAVTVLAFWPGMTAALTHYDDGLYLYQNTALLGRPGWAGLLGVWDSGRVWRREFVEFFPLRDTVYWLIYQTWKLNELPYHLTSLLFHVVASLLALRLALALGLSRWAAAFVGLVFAVHPIHIESVEWAAGLKDPMYSTFMFGSVLAYARFRATPRPWLYGVTLGLLVASLLVKSMAVSAPLLMLAMERWVGTPTPWRVIVKRLSGPVLVTGLFFLQFVRMARANDVVVSPHGGSWSSHLVLAAWAQVRYLQQAIVPSTFRLIYCFEPPTGLLDARLGAAVLMFAALGALFVAWKQRPLFRFCVVWYFACLLPVSNLVPFPAVMADRYLYAAVFGVIVVLVSFLERLHERLRTWVLGLMVVTLATTTAARAAVWQDEETLFAEPDEDPACMVDRSFPASDSHLLRYWATPDKRVGYEALKRGIAAPSLMNTLNACTILQQGALVGSELGDDEAAAGFARQAAARCGGDTKTWSAMVLSHLRLHPSEALVAAERLVQLSKAPQAQLYLAMAQVAAGHPDAAARLEQLVRDVPQDCCPLVLGWAERAPEQAGPARAAIEHCVALARGRAPAP